MIFLGINSICSKILLQINAKLGGISYKVIFDKEVVKSKLMIIGINSSHIEDKRTGVALVATINDSFTDFFNKSYIIEEKKKNSFFFMLKILLNKLLKFIKMKIGKIQKVLLFIDKVLHLNKKYFYLMK